MSTIEILIEHIVGLLISVNVNVDRARNLDYCCPRSAYIDTIKAFRQCGPMPHVPQGVQDAIDLLALNGVRVQNHTLPVSWQPTPIDLREAKDICDGLRMLTLVSDHTGHVNEVWNRVQVHNANQA